MLIKIKDIINTYGKWEKTSNDWHNITFVSNLQPNRYEIITNYINQFTDETLYTYIEKSYCNVPNCGCISISNIFNTIIKTDNFEIIYDFFNFIITSNLVIKNNDKFQKIIIIEIVNMNKNHIENIKIFEYFIFNIIEKSNLIKSFNFEMSDNKYTLFHSIFWDNPHMTDQQFLSFFNFFESIGFNFMMPECNDLLSIAISNSNYVIIQKMIEKGFNINDLKITEVICKKITRINAIKHIIMRTVYDCNDYINKRKEDNIIVLKHIYNNLDIIKDLFTPLSDDINVNTYDYLEIEIRDKKIDIIIDELFINNQMNRREKRNYFDRIYETNQLFIKKRWLEQDIKLFETINDYGFKPNEKILPSIDILGESIYNERMDLLTFYNFGCNPIKAIYPKLHYKIIKLFQQKYEVTL